MSYRLKRPYLVSLLTPLLILICILGHSRTRDVQVIFIEPLPGAEAPDVYQVVRDPERVTLLESWLANESSGLALDLFAMAWALTPQGLRGEPPVFYVALVAGGNHASVGLRLEDDENPEAHARTSFIKLSEEDWAFRTTFLHETGHVILTLLSSGIEIPKRKIAAIPHTTAALTDRGTAFDEGFAIHLETLAAHFANEDFLKDRYHHRRFLFGVPSLLGEYHHHAGDLLSFSQTIARYYEVRENNFSFSPAHKGPDYLRVQLEKSRDFATLRDANQLLQCEGFHASFFFGLLMRGRQAPEPELVQERQQKMLAAMAQVLKSGTRSAEDPLLLHFVEAYTDLYPTEAPEVIDVLLDLSHGVFVDRQAAELWREHYLGALRLDLAEGNNQKLEAARSRWRKAVAEDLKMLFSQLGPQLRAEVPGVSVTLVAFGESNPLSFDLNTVEEGVIRLIPGITDTEVEAWIRARGHKPFADVEDFRKRTGVREQTYNQLSFAGASADPETDAAKAS